jgi:hypothetical protein
MYPEPSCLHSKSWSLRQGNTLFIELDIRIRFSGISCVCTICLGGLDPVVAEGRIGTRRQRVYTTIV